MATVLVVDDLAVNRLLLVRLLRSQGHRLIEASDGREAVAAVQAERPDLVITDVLMPVMDGYELVRQLRLDPTTRAIPVVFYTAHYGEREARALALSNGVAAVLAKPIEAEEVLKIVARVLSGESRAAMPPDAAPLTTEFDRAHLRLVTDKLSEKAAGVRTANARLRALIDIGLDLASERDADRLLQSVCVAARDLFGATYVTLGILGPGDQTVQHLLTIGADADWIKPGEAIPGMLATVVAERRTLRGDNPGGDPAGLRLPVLHPDVHAFLAAPIASPTLVYGWICLVGNEGRPFTEDDEHLVTALSGQVGRIYENDRYSQMLADEVVARAAELVERSKHAAVLADQAALLDLAQDAIIVRDMRSRILFWNRGAEDMYGWASHEALGRHMRDLLGTEVSEPTEDVEAELLREGRWEGEAIHYTRDGRRLVVASRWALQLDTAGAPVKILTISNDITDRKQADAERLLLTERLSLATAVAKVGVWEWDLGSNALTWDATMFDIYGFAPIVPIPYETWSAVICPEDLPAIESEFRKAIHDKGQGSSEYRIMRTDGSVKNISAVERVILDERGNVTRLIGVNMDVTARTKAEQILEQGRLDRMRFRDEFLSHVSHELRSPLTAIKQFTSILLSGVAGELNPEQREYEQIVLRNIRQLQSMIDDLLDVTRLETGKLTVEPARVSIPDAVTDALDTLQGPALAKGVTVSRDLLPDLPAAYADPTRLRQILIILLDNAVKFTPEGGVVRVRARLQPDDPRLLLLEVSDTGCGISPEMTGKIFDRLYQDTESLRASRKGLGLGLYICKELVTRQGGVIWVTPQAPTGSAFAFTLPVFRQFSGPPLSARGGRAPESVMGRLGGR